MWRDTRRRLVVLGLLCAGCGGDFNLVKFTPGDENNPLRIDQNLSRLGASDVQSALASRSRLAEMPRSWLMARFEVGVRSPLAMRPVFQAPLVGELSTTSTTPIGTPAFVSTLSPSLSRLVVAKSGAVDSYQVNDSGLGDNSNACDHFSGASTAAGGAITLGFQNGGRDFYYVDVNGTLQKGTLSTSCGMDGVSPAQVGSNFVVAAQMIAWVVPHGVSDYVYLVDGAGNVLYSDGNNTLTSPLSLGVNGVSLSSPVIYNAALWVGDDGGHLWKVALDESGVPQATASSLDLCASIGGCSGTDIRVSVPFIDVSYGRVLVTMQNHVIGVNEADNSYLDDQAMGRWNTGDAVTPATLSGNSVYFATSNCASCVQPNSQLFRVAYDGSQIGANLLTDASGSTARSLSGAVSSNAPPMLNPWSGAGAIYVASGGYYSRFGDNSSMPLEVQVNQTLGTNVVGTPLSDGNYVFFSNNSGVEQQGLTTVANSCSGNAACFGGSCGGTCNPTLSGFSLGTNHVCAVSSDHTAWCWGQGRWGQLGSNSTPSQINGPAQMLYNNSGSLTPLSDIAAVGGGGSFSCALKNDGTVWCTGGNGSGQIGNNSNTTTFATAAQVVTAAGALTGVSQLSVGSQHSCAITTAGAAYCWGFNSSGQLGINSTLSSKYAIAVKNTLGQSSLSNVVQVAAGNAHTCAITAIDSSTQAYCWGSRAGGRLGDNLTSGTRLYPIAVVNPSGFTSPTVISAGSQHTCAVSADSTAWCWGSGNSGRLGNNGSTTTGAPVQVYRLDALGTSLNSVDGVVAIAAGSGGSCASRSDHSVWCWGSGLSGGLGNNAGNLTSVQVTAVPVTSDGANALTDLGTVAAAPGTTSFFCAQRKDRSLWCWGQNNFAQINNRTTSSTYADIGSPLSSANQVVVGNYATCATQSDGNVYCWGKNDIGNLGNGTTNSSPHAAVQVQLGSSPAVSSLSHSGGADAYGETNCALKSGDGSVWCWGLGATGQLGDGTGNNSSAPTQVTDGNSGLTDIRAITGGFLDQFAIGNNGTLWAWGDNSYGRLGINSTATAALVATPIALGRNVVSVGAGDYHSCFVDDIGAVWCAGSNSNKQLGTSGSDTIFPVQAGTTTSPTLPSISQIVAGTDFSCALANTGAVWCWGANNVGQLGNNTLSGTASENPVEVSGLSDVRALSAGGGQFACAIVGSNRNVWCWGTNYTGELGNNSTTFVQSSSVSSVPVQVVKSNGALSGVNTLSAFKNSVCATISGTLYCWGSSANQQLGYNTIVGLPVMAYPR